MDDRLDRVGQPEQSPSNPLDIEAAFQEIYRSPSPKGPILSAQAVYSRGTSFPPPSVPSIEAPLEDKLFSQPEPEGEALTFGKDPEQTDLPAHEPIWAVLPKEGSAGGESSRKSSSRLPSSVAPLRFDFFGLVYRPRRSSDIGGFCNKSGGLFRSLFLSFRGRGLFTVEICRYFGAFPGGRGKHSFLG